MASWTAITGFLLLLRSSLGREISPIVQTSKGLIEGINVDPNPLTGLSYRAFLGVPYGDKPVRFQLPRPKTPWGGVLKANTETLCPQEGSYSTNEDCLHLNVYTPLKTRPRDKLPVMVFIPGGVFRASRAITKRLGPDFLITQNVIFVTVNYRVGAVGFLSLGIKEAPGNLGLHDTRLALQWVQREIAHFGGDPAQVTLFGQSSGGTIAHFHYMSLFSVGLFNKAIFESGCSLVESSHVPVSEARRRSRLLAKAVGCDIRSNTSAMIHCLQQVDIDDLVANQTIPLPDQIIIHGYGSLFTPVLEDFQYADRPFFSGPMKDMLKQSLDRNIPLILGINKDEGIVKFQDENVWVRAEDFPGAFIPLEVEHGLDEAQKTVLSINIKDEYFKKTRTQRDRILSVVKLYTDTNFAYPMVKLSRYYANLAFGYCFAYEGGWNRKDPFMAMFNISGTSHGSEMRYLFHQAGVQSMTPSASNIRNLKMLDMMVRLWTSFAKNGVPSPAWKKISAGGYMVLDSAPYMVSSSEYEKKYYNFWASIEEEARSLALK